MIILIQNSPKRCLNRCFWNEIRVWYLPFIEKVTNSIPVILISSSNTPPPRIPSQLILLNVSPILVPLKNDPMFYHFTAIFTAGLTFFLSAFGFIFPLQWNSILESQQNKIAARLDRVASISKEPCYCNCEWILYNYDDVCP